MSAKSSHPVSPARLAANRANAQKSTGPRTEEGKLRAAANAVQHGFAGSNFAVIRLEDPFEIDKLKADLVATYQPVNPQEMFAIESIALHQQSMRRASRLEAGVLTACIDDAFDRRSDQLFTPLSADMIAATVNSPHIQALDITRSQNRNFGLATGLGRSLQKQPDAFKLFLRYQAQAERLYRRAVEDLLRLISMRDQLALPQTVCQQAPADPDPVLTPHELSPIEFPKTPFPNEPNNGQPSETKPFTTPPDPGGQAPQADSR